MKFRALPALLSGMLLAGAGPAWGQAARPGAPLDFQGRLLVVVSDADMVPSAYLDGQLGPPAGADALAVIRLGGPPNKLRAVEIPVSNSVTGPPSSLAVTPDGRYALVIETRGPRPAGQPNARLRDLAIGRAISVVDLADPDRPRLVQRMAGFEQPASVAINAAGSLVAVTYGTGGGGQWPPLAVYGFSGGRLSEPQTPAIPGWTAGDELIDAEFHPQENVLVLLNATRPAVSFVQVAADKGGLLALTSWGNAVGMEKAPYLARFTPDGRHVLVNAIYGDGEVLDGGMGAPRGTVASVRVAAERGPDGTPRHRLVSRAQTGVLPEGLNISPDGRWVVTANLERSTAAPADPRQGFFSSLTLLRLDPATGLLERVGDFALDGMLPETAVFDNSSRYLAATTFAHFDPARPGGAITFWRLAQDYFDPRRVELVKTDYTVPVTRGPHSMVIVR